MIHSMSGGVLSENGTETFAKVEIDGAPYWYIARQKTEQGDIVLVPFGKSGALRQGVVLRTEVCSAHTAPVSMHRAREIECIVRKHSSVPGEQEKKNS